MPTLILNHRVTNYDFWKTKFDADVARRISRGIKEIVIGQKAGDPGMVYIVMSIDDISGLHQMMNDKELQKLMQESGVVSTPEMIIIE